MKMEVFNLVLGVCLAILSISYVWLGIQQVRLQRAMQANNSALILSSATEAMILKAEAPDAKGAFIIHKPVGGCPKGWVEDAYTFQERDGSWRPGCMLARSVFSDGMSVDFLDGGESLPLRMPLQDFTSGYGDITRP